MNPVGPGEGGYDKLHDEIRCCTRTHRERHGCLAIDTTETSKLALADQRKGPGKGCTRPIIVHHDLHHFIARGIGCYLLFQSATSGDRFVPQDYFTPLKHRCAGWADDVTPSSWERPHRSRFGEMILQYCMPGHSYQHEYSRNRMNAPTTSTSERRTQMTMTSLLSHHHAIRLSNHFSNPRISDRCYFRCGSGLGACL